MNAQDCDRIGYHLCFAENLSDLIEHICALDPRIREHFDAYRDVQGQNDAVQDVYETKMKERLGNNWMLQKEAKVIGKEILEEARREVYAEDYEMVFGKAK